MLEIGPLIFSGIIYNYLFCGIIDQAQIHNKLKGIGSPIMEAILRREILVNKTACRAFGVTAFVLLTALGGFVRIPLPFTPVPVTLQTFFVLLAGALLGRNLGMLAQGVYLVLSVAGFGPTSGYFIGFVVAALFTGSLVRYSGKNFFLTFAIFCLADLALLLCGTLWLKMCFSYSFPQLLMMGVIPFIPGDMLKAFAATVVYQKLCGRAKEIF
jgi:biotin transport system substrate-specific component